MLTIDPASGTVTGALPVGGLPTVLAISDDCSALYVGISTPAAPPTPTPQIDGADSVRRIDLASMTVGPPVSVGKNSISAITPGTYVDGVIAGAARTRIALGSGWIFASDGHALNAATLEPLGRYGDGLIANYAAVAPFPDPDGADVWFLSEDATGMALLDFDRTMFQLRRAISLGYLPGDSDLSNASPLVRLSPTGFAFRTYERLYLIELPN